MLWLNIWSLHIFDFMHNIQNGERYSFRRTIVLQYGEIPTNYSINIWGLCLREIAILKACLALSSYLRVYAQYVLEWGTRLFLPYNRTTVRRNSDLLHTFQLIYGGFVRDNAILKACIALPSYIFEFMHNNWIGNEILSVVQSYNSTAKFRPLHTFQLITE